VALGEAVTPAHARAACSFEGTAASLAPDTHGCVDTAAQGSLTAQGMNDRQGDGDQGANSPQSYSNVYHRSMNGARDSNTAQASNGAPTGSQDSKGAHGDGANGTQHWKGAPPHAAVTAEQCDAAGGAQGKVRAAHLHDGEEGRQRRRRRRGMDDARQQ
jgi:hypothetical protein